jgi:hypothetical protein
MKNNDKLNKREYKKIIEKQMDIYYSNEYQNVLKKVNCKFRLIFDKFRNFGNDNVAFVIFKEYLNIDLVENKAVLNIHNYIGTNFNLLIGDEVIREYELCEKTSCFILHQSVSNNPLDVDCLKILHIENGEVITYDVLKELHNYFEDFYIFIEKSKKVFFFTHDLGYGNFRYVIDKKASNP